MTYLWLKALHVAAVLAFVGGTLAEAVFLAALTPTGMHSTRPYTAVDVVRRWSRWVTTPAMLLAWTLGLTLALRGGWFLSTWLPIKLVFVVLLSGLHGLQSGMLRRMAHDPGRTPSKAQRFNGPFIVAATAVIAVLAVLKPF